MINKIVGFTILREKKDYNFDFFNTGLSDIELYQNELYIHLWGIGNLKKCIINGVYSLSFPLSTSLNQRNILIRINDDKIIIENDWLSSIPVFYNKKEIIVSTLYNVCFQKNKININGLKNFFSAGYSIYGYTPFEDIKYLRYYSKLLIDKKNLKVTYKKDTLKKLKNSTTISEINDLINFKLKSISKNKKLLLPLSGGFDSRYLGYFIKDYNMSSYTYGLTDNPRNSHEGIIAKKFSKKLKFNNKIIKIDNFTKHIKSWFSIFGSSTHLHGMYQIDFYNKILKIENNFKNKILISGIVGDSWAGSIPYFDLRKDFSNFFYSHNVKIQGFNPSQIDNKFYLHKNSKDFQVVDLIRSKMILLSYLITVPEYFGLTSYSPFLDKEVVMKILSLPKDLRKKRKWQKLFFEEEKINFNVFFYKKRNTLDLNSILQENFPEIENDFSLYLPSKLLKEIQSCIIEKKFSKFDLMIAKLYCFPYIGFLVRRLKIKSKIFRSFNNYMIIKAIDNNLI